MEKEKGITLVEVIAVMAILMLISTVIYGVLIGVNKNTNKISSKNSLDQKANLVFTSIKSTHLGKSTYQIKYDQNTKAFTLETTTLTNNLGKKGEIYSLEINNEDDTVLLLENTDLIAINPSLSKSITLTLHLGKQGEYKYETSIKRY